MHTYKHIIFFYKNRLMQGCPLEYANRTHNDSTTASLFIKFFKTCHNLIFVKYVTNSENLDFLLI